MRYNPGVEKEFRSSEEFKKVLAVIKSIPSQLHLCYSSVPGAGFGICATDVIPSGTWIGPYEGKRVSIEEIGSMFDTRHVWEVIDLIGYEIFAFVYFPGLAYRHARGRGWRLHPPFPVSV